LFWFPFLQALGIVSVAQRTYTVSAVRSPGSVCLLKRARTTQTPSVLVNIEKKETGTGKQKKKRERKEESDVSTCEL